MNLTLPTELEQLIRAKVESGGYESAARVIEEALQLLDERDELRRMRRERLVARLAEGILEADNRHLVEGDEVLRGLRNKTGPLDE